MSHQERGQESLNNKGPSCAMEVLPEEDMW